MSVEIKKEAILSEEEKVMVTISLPSPEKAENQSKAEACFDEVVGPLCDILVKNFAGWFCTFKNNPEMALKLLEIFNNGLIEISEESLKLLNSES